MFHSGAPLAALWASSTTPKASPWIRAATSTWLTQATTASKKFDSSGNTLASYGTYGEFQGQFDEPEGVAVDGAGSIYVADANNERVENP